MKFRTYLIIALGLLWGSAWAGSKQTALDRYVSKPDTNYQYKLLNTIRGNGQTTFVLEMTSQQWLTTNEVNQPLWKHWLTIIKPDKIETSKALLMITGGSIDRPPPKSADMSLLTAAMSTRSVVAELR